MITIMLIVFILGYVLIAMEHKINVNKAAVALVLGMVLWTLYVFSDSSFMISSDPAVFHDFITQHADDVRLSREAQIRKYMTNPEIMDQLGHISEILFYLLGAMTIVATIDVHHGFAAITNRIRTRSKRKLLWLVAFITFFMSSVLDNMTSAIVMMMMMHKLSDEQRERRIFGSIIIIAANAGGAWTPIGDVTTTMLWINGNISSEGIMKSIFIPSLISLVIPVWLISLSFKGRLAALPGPVADRTISRSEKRGQNRILLTGLLCLVAVPVFKWITGLPPFAGILLTLGLFWIYTDLLYHHKNSLPSDQHYRIPDVLSKVDYPTILFFLGILMSVAALEATGLLHSLSDFLNTSIHNVYLISILIGFLSSIIDNVPLVAATIDMYPLPVPGMIAGIAESQYMMNFVSNGDFWNLIAYCTGTGGSIMIIGSAAGVVIMGLEKINFIWYLRHITWIAAIGFLAGAGIYYLQSLI